MRGRDVSALHFLLDEGGINDVAFANGAKGGIEIGWFMIGSSIVIPCFDDIESAFGTDGESINLIGGIGKMIQHDSNDMIDINIGSIRFLTAKGITTAANVIMTFPEGRRRIAHHKEHTVGEVFNLESIHDRPKVSPGFHDTETNECIQCPFGFIRRVEIKGP